VNEALNFSTTEGNGLSFLAEIAYFVSTGKRNYCSEKGRRIYYVKTTKHVTIIIINSCTRNIAHNKGSATN
jgi:hypothetical protein